MRRIKPAKRLQLKANIGDQRVGHLGSVKMDHSRIAITCRPSAIALTVDHQHDLLPDEPVVLYDQNSRYSPFHFSVAMQELPKKVTIRRLIRKAAIRNKGCHLRAKDHIPFSIDRARLAILDLSFGPHRPKRQANKTMAAPIHCWPVIVSSGNSKVALSTATRASDIINTAARPGNNTVQAQNIRMIDGNKTSIDSRNAIGKAAPNRASVGTDPDRTAN